MSPQERAQLTRFLQMLEQAQAGAKDPEAQALIAQAASRQPDAAYLLVQRVLQLEMAQQASDAEIARLKQQVAEGSTNGLPPSFFGATANAWGRRPEPSIAGPAAAAPAAGAATQQQAPQSTWGSGLMGTVASTAAGVVAGSLLAHGLGSLFGNRERDAHQDAGSSPVPPGGGTLVETDYGAGNQGRDGGNIADDFDPGDSGSGDVG
jgi:hypothetical protein